MSTPSVNVSVPFEELLRAALSLPDEQKAQLARELWEAVERAEEEAWEAIPENRALLEQARREADTGDTVTWEECVQRHHRAAS